MSSSLVHASYEVAGEDMMVLDSLAKWRLQTIQKFWMAVFPRESSTHLTRLALNSFLARERDESRNVRNSKRDSACHFLPKIRRAPQTFKLLTRPRSPSLSTALSRGARRGTTILAKRPLLLLRYVRTVPYCRFRRTFAMATTIGDGPIELQQVSKPGDVQTI